MSKTTYTKLRSGAWGIRTEGYIPNSGVSVLVTKKDGTTKREHVAEVVWSDRQKNVSICSLQSTDHGEHAVRRTRNVEELYKRRYGWDGKRGSSSYYASGMYDEES